MFRGLVIAFAVVGCSSPNAGNDATPGDTPLPSDAPPEVPVGKQVFAHDRLHRIEIEVAAEYLNRLESDTDNRVPCIFIFDGQRLDNVGIRKKAGYGSRASIYGKTGFSLKFDQFVAGQKLDGLKRFVLNNAQEDATFLSETVGYQSYREFGLIAPLTSHAQVKFNGEDKGIFIIKEAIASDFLERVFGKNNDGGNLYEGFFHPPPDQSLGDFVTHPEQPDLKDEVSEGRSRADLIALARVIDKVPANEFATQVAAQFELDTYIKSVALDTLLGYWDSYAYFLNNYYLYHSPVTNKFIYIPHGMDQLQYTAPGMVMGRLLVRIRAITALKAQFDRETAALKSAWPAAALVARIDEVAAVIRTATRGPRTDQDLNSFESNYSTVRSAVANRGK